MPPCFWFGQWSINLLLSLPAFLSVPTLFRNESYSFLKNFSQLDLSHPPAGCVHMCVSPASMWKRSTMVVFFLIFSLSIYTLMPLQVSISSLLSLHISKLHISIFRSRRNSSNLLDDFCCLSSASLISFCRDINLFL